MIDTDIWQGLEVFRPVVGTLMATPQFWIMALALLGALWLIVKD